MDPIPLVYGTERTDVRENGECLENDHDNVGFAAIWNWGNLGDGQHTAVVYDDGVEFARSTVTVTTPGKSFLTGASKRVTVDDFPNPGDITVLEWNQGTQHFEIVDFMGSEPIDLGECVEGLMLAPGEMCMGSLLGFDFTVSVNEAGEACIDTGGLVPNVDMCYPDPASLPDIVSDLGIEATKHADGSWTIDSLPTRSMRRCRCLSCFAFALGSLSWFRLWRTPRFVWRIRGGGLSYSGVGVISGWKCEASGTAHCPHLR